MTLPASWTLVPVTGTFKDRNGFPCRGRVCFDSKQAVVIDGIVVVAKTITAQLDATGSLPAGFKLPSTDDPDLSVTGWAYTVREIIGGARPPYEIFVEHDAVSIDLATVAPVVPPPELESTRGPAGKSAYQIALDEGFVGDEAAWLASLAGPEGPEGPPGTGEGGMTELQLQQLNTLLAVFGGWFAEPPVISFNYGPESSPLYAEFNLNTTNTYPRAFIDNEFAQSSLGVLATVSIDWGAGEPVEVFVNPNLLNFQHAYTETGTYNLSIVLTNHIGDSNTLTAEVEV